MILTIAQLQHIASSGGGLSLDASLFTYGQITQVVTAAQSSGKASISLHNVAGFTASQMVALALLAPGLVSFEISA